MLALKPKSLTLITFATLFAVLCLPGFARLHRGGRTQGKEDFITVAGVRRRYLVHLPPGYNHRKPTPLIFMLHGGGASPEHPGDYRLADAADAKGFVVVYPEWLNRSWNDGREISGRTADDVGFISALVDEMVHDYNVDPKRVYSTGISNGGYMSFTLACKLADKIAAVAPVAGSMSHFTLDACKPAKAVSVLMINGTGDPLVKFEGGPVRGRGDSEPITHVVEFWRKQECGNALVNATQLPDLDPRDGSTVKVESVACPGREVINYTIEGGGHTWPGGVQYLPKRMIGTVNRDLDASETIVDFFSHH